MEETVEPAISEFNYYVEGVGISIIGLVGLAINIIALYILFNRKLMRTFHILMISLTLYDLTLLLIMIIISMRNFSEFYRDKIVVYGLQYLFPLGHVFITGSCYTTIAIAIERFLAVKHPFLINKHNSKFRAIIIPIFLYAFVYNLPRFFQWEIGQEKCKKYQYDYDSSNTNATCTVTNTTKFGNDRIYKLLYENGMNFIFNIILPFSTLAILNYLTYKAMMPHCRQSNLNGSTILANGLRIHYKGNNTLRKIEFRITKASIGITIMYLICHTPRVITNLTRTIVDKDPQWYYYLTSINHLLITMNSSFNFLFYWSYCRNTKKCQVPGDNIQQQNKQNITMNSSLTD